MSVVQTIPILKLENANILLVGNPNVGKSVIFNQLTGSKQKIANFPGTTLSHKSGKYGFRGTSFTIHDLPGIYGFNSGNKEENIAHNFIINQPHDLIVNVVDGRKLERNLILTLQLREMQQKMILVFSFKDKIENAGLKIDASKLQKELGIPVLLISSHKKSDIETLRNLVYDNLQHNNFETDFPLMELSDYQEIVGIVSEELENTILLNTVNIFKSIPTRWMIISILMNPISSETIWPYWIVNKIENIGTELNINKKQMALDLISHQSQQVEKITRKCYGNTYTGKEFTTISDKIDQLLLNPKFGLPIFAVIMLFVFKLTFDISEPVSKRIEGFASILSIATKNNIQNELFASFLADALIGGIGFVMVFIPQIAILYFFIAMMEHTGYISRVVYITDRFLNKINVSGTSIAPLLLGFGCNIPAIIATQSTRDQNERIALILVNPFMSCSARLPVYVIIAGSLFPNNAGLIISILYFSGILIAILVLTVLRKTILKGETTYLMMELPNLSLPPIRVMLQRVYLQVRRFIQKAARWMALGLIVMWLLSITGPSGYIGPSALEDTKLLKETWVFKLGELFQPFFGYFGWDYRLVVALIFGFIAKEIVISSFGLIYGIGNSTVSLELIIASQFTIAGGLAYLFFVLLYTPCIGTFFAIKQEIGLKWAYVSVGMSLVIAYFTAFLVFTLTNLII